MTKEKKGKEKTQTGLKENSKTPEDKEYSLKNSEKINFTIGLILLAFTVYLALAMLSYLFTWKSDQSQLNIGFFSFVFETDVDVENWSGKTGAILAHILIHKWFGISSFIFIYVMGLTGLRLLNIKIPRYFSILKKSILIIIWLSLTLGFIAGTSFFVTGGLHGYYLSRWISSLIGVVGTALIILISLSLYIIYNYKNALPFVQSQIAKWAESKKADEVPVTTNITSDEQEEPIENGDGSVVSEISETPVTGDPLLDFEISDTRNLNDIETPLIPGEVPFVTVNENMHEIGEDDDFKEDESSEVPFLVNTDPVDTLTDIQEKISPTVLPVGDYDPTLDLSNFKFPPIDILRKHESGKALVSEEELVTNKNKIVETLGHYNIQIDRIKANVGPTVTLYEIVPAPGVRISQIKKLEDDIALSLAALGIRIIAPIPGKGTIGIEVPNQNPEIVSMRSIISSAKYQETKAELPLVLGKTISNEVFILDLTKMPHLLIAGATGQGKSVGINAVITSLLYKKHPANLKFVLVDPKKVELNLYSKIERHYLAKLPGEEDAIITDTQKVIKTLTSLTIEMDQRYDLLKKAHSRIIKEYNEKFIKRSLNPNNGHRFLPYIVVVIDEFADLIMTAGKEVELPIARLAQLARAVGIHLVIATQRPTTNIITGVIKANFPARIAFRVTSSIDSRTILDATGANQLIGRGDMLVSSGSDLVRVQCAFIDTPEVEELAEFIGNQQGYPTAFQLPECVEEGSDDIGEIDLQKRDELFEEAARLIVAHQQGSTSLVQRKFSIGYNRAGRIIDQLEAAGIVGPFEGSKARRVIPVDDYHLEQIINTLENKF